ncbi:hypothetical protein EYZ11_008106 [Aspergillus tanneri]|uniref:Uncharacterized protein n=1 Tax=Aspergillus tanneri TaxID=1220188 RepID=A0A4S3JBC4_9EURO|nr:hypothetical protein EYZ11_008106 [Aspergillus tanneri]
MDSNNPPLHVEAFYQWNSIQI